jgi:predicted ATP-dependent endonuclease of OLD family
MRLVTFTVQDFRSITSARQIKVGQITTLLGPNNEGKSNILKALAIAVNYFSENATIIEFSDGRVVRIALPSRRKLHSYDWDADYPLSLQKKNKDGGSLITLEFELDDEECEAFRAEVGSKTNGRLPIQLFCQKNGIKPIIPKRGPGQATLNRKAARIAEFLAKRIDVQYIPAIRTSKAALEVVDSLVARELANLESNPKYVQALSDIDELQTPLLEKLSNDIAGTMKQFVPAVTQVEVKIEKSARKLALRSASAIIVNDGVATALDRKGEGVQSLAALAIMRHASDASNAKKSMVVALEEPESHLHPRAIHQLRDVIYELAQKHQVVLATHNPLFVNCSDVASNIIVHSNRATPAESLEQIRDVSGVRVSDNLKSAELVLVVEGEPDREVLEALLAKGSPILSSAMKSRRLVVDVLGGAQNLAHRVRLHKEGFCKVHAFLDNDQEGRSSYGRAEKEGLLSSADINYANWGTNSDTEIEDLFVEEISDELVGECFGACASHPEVKGKKWSDRVRRSLKASGKPSDDPYIDMLKARIAQKVAKMGWDAIHPKKKTPLESLIGCLEKN